MSSRNVLRTVTVFLGLWMGSLTEPAEAAESGAVLAWGSVDYFELRPPPDLTNVVALSIGLHHGLALRSDGAVAAWGDANAFGAERPPSGLSNVVQVASGESFGMALRSDGTVVAWGDNQNEQVAVPPQLRDVVEVAAGGFHGLALTRSGVVWAWGGRFVSEAAARVPPDLGVVVAIGAGKFHSLAVTADGKVQAWGDNVFGQCTLPVGLSGVRRVAGGALHSVALTEEGLVHAWGGDRLPGPPSGLSGVVAVASGVEAYHSLALHEDGSVVAWGSNLFSPLETPPGYTNLLALAGGNGVSFGITRAPVAVRSPVGGRVPAGTDFRFSGEFVGAVPWSLQWYKDGAPIPEATGPTLNLTNVRSPTAGAYALEARNDYGSILSATAVLAVDAYPPELTQVPGHATVTAGVAVEFVAQAKGAEPLFFQWTHRGAALSGATNRSLTLPSVKVDDAGPYVVRVSNEYGSVASEPVQLVVHEPPTMVTREEAVSLVAGESRVLRAVATGEPPLGFQWFWEDQPIPGATHSSYLLPEVQADREGRYSLTVENAYGRASNVVVALRVLTAAPAITLPTSSVVVALGHALRLRARVLGTAPMALQWWHDGQPIPGATNQLYDLTRLEAGNSGVYWLAATNALGSTASSNLVVSVGDPYPGEVDWPALSFEEVTKFESGGAVTLAAAGDGSPRLFVADRAGWVRVIDERDFSAQTFLDFREKVRVLKDVGGVISLTFSPSYATDGFLYVAYARKPDWHMVLSRWSRDDATQLGNPASEEVLLTIPKSPGVGFGGAIAFGPDGFLYYGTGDIAGYPRRDFWEGAQDGASLSGKILRLDPASQVRPYGIPHDNPFRGNSAFAPEVWALGLYDPRYFSFDRETGDLWLVDRAAVGYDEVNHVVAGDRRGHNFGWPLWEGNILLHTLPEAGVPLTSVPVATYSRLRGLGPIVGGHVYRGSRHPRLRGIYLHGDAAAPNLAGMRQVGTNWSSAILARFPSGVGGFGVSEAGEIYVAGARDGRIFRVGDARSVLPIEIAPGGGRFANDQRVTVKSASPGVRIYYTDEGRDPTEFDRSVSELGTHTVSGAGTLRFRAYRDDLEPSPVAEAVFSLAVAPPSFDPPVGPITQRTRVTVTTETEGAEIHYTTDGAEPTRRSPRYDGTLLLDGNTRLMAAAFKEGYADSAAVSTYYEWAAVPGLFTSPAGGILTNGAPITLESVVGAEIHYSTDGTEPTLDSPRYTSPILWEAPSVVKARAWLPSYAPSPVAQANYSWLIVEPTVVQTFAGGTTPGFQDGPRTEARFNAPFGLALDRDGSVLVADTGNHRIRRIGGNGQVVTVAGTGEAGSLDGPAQVATFDAPTAVALGAAGEIFVVDSTFNLLRVIGVEGQVTTRARLGLPFQMPVLGQPVVDAQGVCFVGGLRQVFRVAADGVVSTLPGTGACCETRWPGLIGLAANPPQGLIAAINQGFDSGDVALVTLGWDGAYEVFAGSSPGYQDGPRLNARLVSPMALARAPDGSYVVSDATRVRRLDVDGIVKTLAGAGESGYADGRGTTARFGRLGAVAVDAAGVIWIADPGNHCIRTVAADSREVGIADVWQRMHFGALGVIPEVDSDGDGTSNLEEFQRGTSPVGEFVPLELEATRASEGGVRLEWRGGWVGLEEFLERSVSASWNIGTAVLFTNRQAVPSERGFLDHPTAASGSGAGNETGFYRVRQGVK